MAASQRSAAADVGHGAGAGCCAVAGAAPECLEVTSEGVYIISHSCQDAVRKVPSFVDAGFVSVDDR